MENQDDIDVIKEAISLTLKNEGIDTFQVYLFGSRARGWRTLEDKKCKFQRI